MEEETKKTEESTVIQETTPTTTTTTTTTTTNVEVVKSSTVLEEKLAEKVLKEEKTNTTTTTTAPPQNAPKAPPQNVPKKTEKKWSSAEHSLLLGLHNTYGDNWNQISKFMPGRTPDEIASRHREVMTQAQRSSREMLSKMMINPQQPLFAALASLAGGIRPSGIPSPAVIPAMSAALKTNGQSRAMNLYELLYQKKAPGAAMGGIPPNFIPPPLPPPNMNPLSQQQMMMMLQAQQQQQQQQQFPPNLNLMAAFRNNPLLTYPPPPPGLLPMFPPMMNPSLMQAQQNPLLRPSTTKPVTKKPKSKRKSSKKKQEAIKTKKEEWVQCDRCKKWRKLPSRVSAKKLPDIWYCEMTTWGRRKVTCDTPVHSDKKKSSNVVNNSKKNKEQEDKKIAKVEWVQCETCLTWRKLPLTIKASSLPDKWYCRMNHWDKSRASCSAPQEIVETVKVRFFRHHKKKEKNDSNTPIPTIQVRGAKSVTSAEFDAHNSVYHTAEMKGKGSNALSYRTLIPAHYKSNGMQRSGKSRKTGVGLTLYWYLARSSHFVRKPGHVVPDRAVSSLEPTRRADRARAMARGEDMFKWEPDAVSVMLSKPPKLEMVKLPSPESDEEEQDESNKTFLAHCEELKCYGDLVRREDELVEKLLTRLSVQNLPAECVWQHAPWMEYLLRDLIERGLVEEVRDENDCLLEYKIAANRYKTEKELPSRHIRVQMPLRVSKPWKKVPKKRKRPANNSRYSSADSNRSRRGSKRRKNASDSSNEDNE